MSAKVISGKELSQEIRLELKERVKLLKEKNIVPGLAVILVGNDPASISYVTGKEKACIELGMNSFQFHLPENITEPELLQKIEELNNRSDVHGILVQLPLPKHINPSKVIEKICVEKDVDGFTKTNVGSMFVGEKCFIPCTPHGVLKLIEKAGINTKGACAVVVGRSNIVGKPLASLLASKKVNSTVIVCHTGTVDLAKYTKQADILIVCAGKPEFIKKDMIKEGACVIDVGVNRIPDSTKKNGFRLVGDVDFNGASEVASCITPVPGGVGPMTITMLMANTVESAENCL